MTMDKVEMTTPVSSLTVGQLRTLIRETVEEAVSGLDPDAGLRLRPEIAQRLQASLKSNRSRLSHQEFWEAVER